METEYIEPFILSACKVVKEMCQIELHAGEPALAKEAYQGSDTIVTLGLFGNLTGEMVLDISDQAAQQMADRMVMGLADTAGLARQSAMAELGSVIVGNAAAFFSNRNIMITSTPPNYYKGEDFCPAAGKAIRIPFTCDAGEMVIGLLL